MDLVRQVWSHNLYRELAIFNVYLSRFPVIVIDTEFPGFIRSTPRGAPKEHLYQDLKFNLNHLKILQLGLTLVDENGNVGMTWEFTFSDFDEQTDLSNPTSIQFLKNKGLDFKKQREEGIRSAEFQLAFLPILCSNRIVKWVTFHGIYDVAYLLKLMVIKSMPESVVEFAIIARCFLGTVSDLKYIIRNCEYLLNGELGLKKLAKLLNIVNDIPTHHLAGFDSLLIASAYAKMKKMHEFSSENLDGFLYGLYYRIRGHKIPWFNPYYLH
ncbi:putative CCR4-associated factor 1 homolog 8 [Benincasa hispida]|uniref:putative CCR4-associated factor 1 homolog 8 n=1 Tax=Benincasa hispida TaxID=102211 RepID=UPI00190219F7|nr:putative CCR4-associated factor 1 homolog 8 [Benincasa hispida]